MERVEWVRHRRAWWCGFLGLLAAALAVQHVAGAQTSRSRESRLDTAAIEKKLDVILANQQTVLQKLDAVMEELRVVKVRCTR